jgi:tripartite-type tricarboxylate transporter receptor subunit TctC
MVTGDTQASFLNVASSAPMIKAGKLKPLALVNHARLPEYPDLPTMQEVGFPGVGTLAWQGMFAPAATPKEVLETIYKATVQALNSQGAKDAFDKQHFNLAANKSLDDAKTWLAGEIKSWREITSAVKIETE